MAITLYREDLASDAALRTTLDQGLLMAADTLSPRERAAAWKEQEREEGPVVAVLHTAHLDGDGEVAGLGSLYSFRSNACGDDASTCEDLLRFIRERRAWSRSDAFRRPVAPGRRSTRMPRRQRSHRGRRGRHMSGIERMTARTGGTP